MCTKKPRIYIYLFNATILKNLWMPPPKSTQFGYLYVNSWDLRFGGIINNKFLFIRSVYGNKKMRSRQQSYFTRWHFMSKQKIKLRIKDTITNQNDRPSVVTCRVVFLNWYLYKLFYIDYERNQQIINI